MSALGAIGTTKSGYEARVINQDGEGADVDQPGVLQVNGVSVTKGYIKNEDANAKAFTEDGYYRTRGLVKKDQDGLFWYVSRCKDLMKYQTTHIYPCEIKQVALMHPQIADCGVFGVFSKELSSDLPRTYITLLDEEDLKRKTKRNRRGGLELCKSKTQ